MDLMDLPRSRTESRGCSLRTCGKIHTYIHRKKRWDVCSPGMMVCTVKQVASSESLDCLPFCYFLGFVWGDGGMGSWMVDRWHATDINCLACGKERGREGAVMGTGDGSAQHIAHEMVMVMVMVMRRV